MPEGMPAWAIEGDVKGSSFTFGLLERDMQEIPRQEISEHLQEAEVATCSTEEKTLSQERRGLARSAAKAGMSKKADSSEKADDKSEADPSVKSDSDEKRSLLWDDGSAAADAVVDGRSLRAEYDSSGGRQHGGGLGGSDVAAQELEQHAGGSSEAAEPTSNAFDSSLDERKGEHVRDSDLDGRELKKRIEQAQKTAKFERDWEEFQRELAEHHGRIESIADVRSFGQAHSDSALVDMRFEAEESDEELECALPRRRARSAEIRRLPGVAVRGCKCVLPMALETRAVDEYECDLCAADIAPGAHAFLCSVCDYSVCSSCGFARRTADGGL